MNNDKTSYGEISRFFSSIGLLDLATEYKEKHENEMIEKIISDTQGMEAEKYAEYMNGIQISFDGFCRYLKAYYGEDYCMEDLSLYDERRLWSYE